MPRPKPIPNSPSSPREGPNPEPLHVEGDDVAWVVRLGEWLRRLALGLTAALVTARAYWPSEPDLKAEAGSGLDWSLAMLLVLGLALASALVGGRLRVRWSWTDAAVIAFFFLVGLSASHAPGRRPAINLAWEWGAVGMAYVLVRNLPRTRAESSVLVGALVATAAAVSVYGLYQVGVELPAMRARYLSHRLEALRLVGIAPGSPAQALYERRLLDSNEPWSTFALTNSLAGFLVGPLVVALTLGWEALREREGRVGRLGAMALAVIPALSILVCLLLTKSRSAYLGLAVALAVLAWRERRRSRPRTLVLTLAGGLIVVAALVFVGLSTHRLDREVITEASKSLRYRQEYWVGAWRVINDSSRAFWSGHGPGNFAGPYLKHKLPQASEEIIDPHNLFLDAWATAGLWAVVALLLALALGFWELLGPASVPATPTKEAIDPLPSDRPDAPPRRAGWLLACSGGGWLSVLVVGDVRLSEGDFFVRWVILGGAWFWAVLLGFPLWRRVTIPAAGLGAGALAVVVNLLAAGGIGISSVSLSLWMLIALGLNLRVDRECSRLRDAGGRLAAFALAAVWAALVGTFAGAVGPFWESEAAIAAAEAAMKRRPPDYARAEDAFDKAIRADQYSTRPFLGLAYLEYEIWRDRGAKPDDLRWKKIPILLLKAASPPRDANAWTLHRDRAMISRDLLDQVSGNLTPSEVIGLRANIVEATRTASRLYPTNPTLHARLAEASAEIGMMPDAVREAKEALRLDRLTPHVDRKLPGPLRSRLEAQLPNWEKASQRAPAPR
jgi:O-antigen ligase